MPDVGHFAQCVQDQCEAIGCASVFSTMVFSGRRYGTYLLTCNYSHGNLLGSPVYESGKTASKCTTGTDRTYPGLCSIYEYYGSHQ